MKVFVFTCDKYLKAVPPFAYLFNKYWGEDQEVIIVGYAKPGFDLPRNFTYLSLGAQENYPFSRWSDSVIRVTDLFPAEEVFCLMLEDYWICQPVRRDVVRKLYDYMRQFSYVLKMDLVGDRRFAGGATEYGCVDDIKLVKSDFNSQYHSSLMTGLWNRALMRRYLLIPNESPHDVELRGTPRLARIGDDILVLGTEIDPWPVKHILAFRGQNIDNLLLEGLSDEDRAELTERNLI